MLFNQGKCKCVHIGRADGNNLTKCIMCIYGLAKNVKENKYRGDNKCRLESVGTMWSCSKKGEPATRDDQDKYYNIIIQKKLNYTII